MPVTHPLVQELGIHPLNTFFRDGKRTTDKLVFAKPEEDEHGKKTHFDEKFIATTHKHPLNKDNLIHYNAVWGSSIKSGTLTGITRQLADDIHHIFTYAESSIRVGSALFTNAWSGGYFRQLRLKVVPVNSQHGIFFVGDGANFIRQSVAHELRQRLVMKPYNLKDWKFGIQSLQQIINPDDWKVIVDELAKYQDYALHIINNNLPLDADQDFVQETEKLELSETTIQRLIAAEPMMAQHPVITAILSKNRADMVFEALTTGGARMTQGFIAFPANFGGNSVVLPPVDAVPRFQSKHSPYYTAIRFPGDSPFANMVVKDVSSSNHELSEYLAIAEGFQNRFVFRNGDTVQFSKGMTYIVPDELWQWDDADFVISSEDIKASSNWGSKDDIDETRNTFGDFVVDGIFTAINWIDKGNMVAIDYKTWKRAGGDFDGDMGGLRSADYLPKFTTAVGKSLNDAEGKITKAKLPKSYTFGVSDRTKFAVDSIAGGFLVGIWSNIATIVAHTNPAELPNIYELLEVLKVHSLFVSKDVIASIGNDNKAMYWALQSIIGLGIQAGTDGFKTNLDNIGGMEFLSELGLRWYKRLRDNGYNTPIITFNPKRNGLAFRDANQVPEMDSAHGIAAVLMKRGLEKLELPEYLDIGLPAQAFRDWAMQPINLRQMEGAKTLRTLCRKELARRNMTDPLSWVTFVQGYWLPMVKLAMSKGVIADKWEPVNPLDPKTKYRPVNAKRVPEFVGIDKYTMANLLWWAFHDGIRTSKGNDAVINSLSPVIWLFEEEVVRLVREKPGLAHLAKEFTVKITDHQKPEPGIYENCSITYVVRHEVVDGKGFDTRRAILKIGESMYLLDRAAPAFNFSNLRVEVADNRVNVKVQQM